MVWLVLLLPIAWPPDRRAKTADPGFSSHPQSAQDNTFKFGRGCVTLSTENPAVKSEHTPIPFTAHSDTHTELPLPPEQVRFCRMTM